MHNLVVATKELLLTVPRVAMVQRRDSVSAVLRNQDKDITTAPFGVSQERERFDAMFSAFEEAGGIADGEEVGRLFEESRCGDYVLLAKAIANGEVLSIAWSNTRWIPLFQFDPQDLLVRQEVNSVLAELRGVYDEWEIGCWFTEPNGWLEARRPLDLLHAVPGKVVQAARADRFIATR